MNEILHHFMDRLAYNVANYMLEYITIAVILIAYTSIEAYFNYRFKKALLKRVEANENKIDKLLDILNEKGCEDLNGMVKTFLKENKNAK